MNTSRLASSFARRSPVLRSDAPLTEEQIRRVAPSIFASDKHASRSVRYTYIPTGDVLRGLAREGFAPFMVTQSRTRDEAHREHTKHMIRLRHADAITGRSWDEPQANEIILINSHNGASSYQMLAGVFRFVCSNGLVSGTVHEDIRIPHKGEILDHVIEGAHRVLQEFRTVDASREAMQAVRLSTPQQIAFGRAALALRYEDAGGDRPAPISDVQVIGNRRPEDSAPDLWTTLNRIQENLTRGGLQGRSAQGRRVTTRPVQGIDANVRLNRALWVLAEEMRRIVA